MTEAEFISLVDCRFPYHDSQEARRLITLGCSISDNAAFTIVHELVCIPASQSIPTAVRLDLLQEFDKQFEHPLKELITNVAKRRINGEELPLPEVLVAIREIQPFRNQYQALNVITMSAAEEAWDAMDELGDEIKQHWQNAI